MALFGQMKWNACSTSMKLDWNRRRWNFSSDSPAVRLYPPGVDTESEEAWFIELLTVPESAEGVGNKWTRLPLAEGHFGLPTFRFLAIIAFDPLPAGNLGIRYARPEMMALGKLLAQRPPDVLPERRVENGVAGCRGLCEAPACLLLNSSNSSNPS